MNYSDVSAVILRLFSCITGPKHRFDVRAIARLSKQKQHHRKKSDYKIFSGHMRIPRGDPCKPIPGASLQRIKYATKFRCLFSFKPRLDAHLRGVRAKCLHARAYTEAGLRMREARAGASAAQAQRTDIGARYRQISVTGIGPIRDRYRHMRSCARVGSEIRL